MAIKAIIFDLDDTLFDHKGAMRMALQEFYGNHPELCVYQNLENFQMAWQDAHRIFYPQFLAGKITHDEQRVARMRAVWAKAAMSLNDDRAIHLSNSYLALYEKHWALFPDTLSCLDRLKSYKLGIITNGWSDQQRKKLIHCGIFDRFEAVIISSEVEHSKPNKKIFQIACEQLKVKCNEAIYVGDIYDIDVAAAENAGLQPLWLLRDQDIIVDSSLNIPSIRSLDEIGH